MSTTTELTSKKNQVKSLLTQIFWQLEDEILNPKTIRSFLTSNSGLPESVLSEFCLNIADGNKLSFWQRIENLCWYILEIKKYR